MSIDLHSHSDDLAAVFCALARQTFRPALVVPSLTVISRLSRQFPSPRTSLSRFSTYCAFKPVVE